MNVFILFRKLRVQPGLNKNQCNFGPCPNNRPRSDNGCCPNDGPCSNKCKCPWNRPLPNEIACDHYKCVINEEAHLFKSETITQMFCDGSYSQLFANADRKSRLPRYYSCCGRMSCSTPYESMPSSASLVLCKNSYDPVKSHTLIVSINNCRSRLAKFQSDNEFSNYDTKNSRDRVPSRIGAKKLCRLLRKSRKLTMLFRRHIRNNIPKSSRIFRLLNPPCLERKRLQSDRVRYSIRSASVHYRRVTVSSTRRSQCFKLSSIKKKAELSKRVVKDLEVATCNTYKSLKHMINCCRFNLSGDIETNPGPLFVEPSKTIQAPYSQGNVDVFGTNAGQQCVPMSLCALIYKYTKTSITDPEDLTIIMNIGNELYSALSRLSRQTYLLLTELPSMVTMLDTNYQLVFSESYTGNLHAVTIDESIPYVMPLTCALQNLLHENYDLFLVTIGCNAVSVYLMSNGSLKIFDSHARDSFGIAHPHGTCVLLEVNSVHNLAEYFKTCYRGDVLFELKGVKITVAQFTSNIQNNTSKSNRSLPTCDATICNSSIGSAESCAIYIYSICFSTIKACKYWNDSTLDAVTENAMLVYKKSLNVGNEFTCNHLPQTLNVHDANIEIVYTTREQGILSVCNKDLLVSSIIKNTVDNTGFLLWLSDYCIACIFDHQKCTKYFLLTYNEMQQKFGLFEKYSSPNFLVNKLYEISTEVLKREEVGYTVEFLSCLHQLSKSEKQRIVRKHKSSEHKRAISEKRKSDYANLQAARKKQCLEKFRKEQTEKYKLMDPLKKKALLETKAEKYKSMNPLKKKALLETKSKKYKSMDTLTKKSVLETQSEKYKSIDPLKKKALLETAAEKYKSMDPLKKKALLETKAEKYKSMNPLKKKALLETKSKKYKSMDTLTKKSVLETQSEKYKSIDPLKKKALLETAAEKYKSMDPSKKKSVLGTAAEKYKSMDASKKRALLETNTKKYYSNKESEKYKSMQADLDKCISRFKNKIKQGPFFVCSVCNRLLYRKSVVLLQKNKYDKYMINKANLFTDIKSFDKKHYICKTCHAKVLKGKIPCQAVYNDMHVDEVPNELQSLEKLEQILIAQRIVFEKIIVMPKGQQRKVKGAICNVPVECDQTCKILPRPPERSGIIMLKLKRKLEFRGHVYFQAVRPQFVLNALNWLKVNNPLYNNITINVKNSNANYISFKQLHSDNELTNKNDFCDTTKEHIVDDDDVEERDDPLNEHRQATNETCLQSVLPDYPVTITQDNKKCSLGSEVYNIAPGEISCIISKR